MPGGESGGGSGRASGGSSVAAGRKAKEAYKLESARKRFAKNRLPEFLDPQKTRVERVA